MPRRKRIQHPFTPHHVMAKGIDGLRVFDSAGAKSSLLGRLGNVLGRQAASCHVWALMPTHYHLVIEPTSKNLGKIMQALNSWFAAKYNRATSRKGYVFHERYKSLAVLSHRYMRELIRYVHLNPIRAGIVETLAELDTYPWTSHFDTVNHPRHKWFRRSRVLSLFGDTTHTALGAYRRFLTEGLERDLLVSAEPDYRESEPSGPEHDLDRRVLGVPVQVAHILSSDSCRKAQLEALRARGVTVLSLARSICAGYDGLGVQDILYRKRANDASEARALVAFACTRLLGTRNDEIAGLLNTTSSGVSRAADRGKNIVEREPWRLKSIL